MKFNTRIVAHEGKEYVFVAKRNQKITDDDIKAFFDLNCHKDVAEESYQKAFPESQVKQAEKPKFIIRDELKKIFLSDLKLGLQFCCKKYGATEDEIMSEAKRHAPEVNLELLMKRA